MRLARKQNVIGILVLLLAAVARVCAALAPGEPVLIDVSAGLWAAAFLGYAALYGPMLVRPCVAARKPNRSPA